MPKEMKVFLLVLLLGVAVQAEKNELGLSSSEVEEIENGVKQICQFLTLPIVLDKMSECLPTLKETQFMKVVDKCNSEDKSIKELVESICNSNEALWEMASCAAQNAEEVGSSEEENLQEVLGKYKQCLANRMG